MFSFHQYIVFTALRDDRYFLAGRAIAVSLVHGGPPPAFFSTTLFDCLVGGPHTAKPLLEDIADTDIYERVKKVSFIVKMIHLTFDQLTTVFKVL